MCVILLCGCLVIYVLGCMCEGKYCVYVCILCECCMCVCMLDRMYVCVCETSVVCEILPEMKSEIKNLLSFLSSELFVFRTFHCFKYILNPVVRLNRMAFAGRSLFLRR